MNQEDLLAQGIEAASKAYLCLLQSSERHLPDTQIALVRLRDFLADAQGISGQVIQDSYDERVAIARSLVTRAR